MIDFVTGEFATYLNYVRGLDFFEKPDYSYLRKLFSELMAKKEMRCDWRFDWIERQVQNGSLLNSSRFIIFHSHLYLLPSLPLPIPVTHLHCAHLLIGLCPTLSLSQ